MGYLELIASLLGVVDKFMSTMPDYEQRKKEKFYRLKKRYLEELVRENPDDNLTDNLRDELQLFVETFSKELSEKNV